MVRMDAQKVWAGLGLLAVLLWTWALVAMSFNVMEQFWIASALGCVAIGAALALAWLRNEHGRTAAPVLRVRRFHLTDRNWKSP